MMTTLKILIVFLWRPVILTILVIGIIHSCMIIKDNFLKNRIDKEGSMFVNIITTIFLITLIILGIVLLNYFNVLLFIFYFCIATEIVLTSLE